MTKHIDTTVLDLYNSSLCHNQFLQGLDCCQVNLLHSHDPLADSCIVAASQIHNTDCDSNALLFVIVACECPVATLDCNMDGLSVVFFVEFAFYAMGTKLIHVRVVVKG